LLLRSGATRLGETMTVMKNAGTACQAKSFWKKAMVRLRSTSGGMPICSISPTLWLR